MKYERQFFELHADIKSVIKKIKKSLNIKKFERFTTIRKGLKSVTKL